MKKKLFKLFPHKYRKYMIFAYYTLLVLLIIVFGYEVIYLSESIISDNGFFLIGIILSAVSLFAYSRRTRDIYIVIGIWLMIYIISTKVYDLYLIYILHLFIISMVIYLNITDKKE
ncbi:MAG: hypothetical protein ACOCRK_10405 [bacterium]